jgi:hypothetical protein
MIKDSITKIYDEAREAVKNNEMDKARDLFDTGLLVVAQARGEGLSDKDLIEDVRVGLWLERLWYGLENNDLLINEGEFLI